MFRRNFGSVLVSLSNSKEDNPEQGHAEVDIRLGMKQSQF